MSTFFIRKDCFKIGGVLIKMNNSNLSKKINQNNKHLSFYAIIKGTIKGLILTVILCIIGALIFKIFDLTKELIPSVSLWISMIGICFSGIFAAKNAGNKGLLHGALTGILFISIINIFSLIVFKTDPLSNTLYKLFIGLAVGILGGVIGINL